MSYAVATALAVWFGLSVLNQIRGGRWAAWARRHDSLQLLPSWALFTTDADRIDVVVLARGRRADGSEGPWRRVPTGDRSGALELVDPDRRVRIAVSNTRYWLLGRLRAGGGGLQGAPPYRRLIRYAARASPGPPDEAGLQLLVATRPARPGAALVPLAITPWHGLDAPDASAD